MPASIAIRSLGSILSHEIRCLFTAFPPSYGLLAWAGFLPHIVDALAVTRDMAPIAVPGPEEASAVFDAFVSYSLEFAFFPDFAGNASAPNTFSDNLLANIGALQGVRPYIRVGGNTQDYALYDESLPYAVNGTYDFDRSRDYPTTVYIGPSFFESYGTFADTKFTHGFNLGLGANRSEGWETLKATVPLACRAIGKDNLDVWEYGNEPDLYSTSAQGPVRPPSWDEAAYVAQWLNGTREIARVLAAACPDFPAPPAFKAPSNGGTANRLRAPAQWAAGLNADANVALFSTHNYISGAESPGVTLQGTLMNHTRTVESVRAHVREYANMTARFGHDAVPPHILGEHNSLYNQGKPGLSNSFGAALWGVDFNLYAASQGIKRSHMHMGTDYRYQSWQPVHTNTTALGTKAPYYGNIAVAAFLAPPSCSSSSSSSSCPPVSVAHIPLGNDGDDGHAAAYAAYHGTALVRILLVDLHAYNSTVNGTGTTPDPDPTREDRATFTHSFAVPPSSWRDGGLAGLRRLRANGSDAVTGVTWDGWSYNHELDGGRPVRLDNVTVGENALVDGGRVVFTVSASEAVVISAPDSGCC
ncbi:beta-glucuronidase [Colletotrichum graminicola]|uniref:Beta-glucuronidase n=1 Tax=Colletotrichum graminicola (strain M1.001 / M2 / FGSC 10212) TaxID=645133 RepID=E3Q3L7_COLGM|nr:beta-glucuronidase [Colletotrichum graminicola M1.001]EFQ25619.1 beta-glucuronidase [Colletotrichum graminicola M1.001]WDK11047.1 beta-glucuronidase [Colletotrichum graminicola]